MVYCEWFKHKRRKEDKIDIKQAIEFLKGSKEYRNIVNNYESSYNDATDKVIELLERIKEDEEKKKVPS